MELAQAAGFEGDQSRSNMRRRREAAGVNDANLTALARPRGLHRFHVEGVLILGGNRCSTNLCLVLLKGLGQATREDVEWRPGRFGDRHSYPGLYSLPIPREVCGPWSPREAWFHLPRSSPG